MRWVKTLLWMIVIIFAILFFVQNKDEVTLRFGLYPLKNYQWVEVSKIPLFFVILCSVIFGVLIGWIGDFFSRIQVKRTLRQNQKMIEKLEREIQSLHDSELEKPSFLKEEE
jgi:uncharacterized integral membrane protein